MSVGLAGGCPDVAVLGVILPIHETQTAVLVGIERRRGSDASPDHT